jgi:hypothetical protein
MSKAEDILNGWVNYLKNDNEEVLEIAKHRAAICSKCPLATFGLHTSVLPDYTLSEIQGLYCDGKKGGCGCPLSTAVRSKNKKCPLGNW